MKATDILKHEHEAILLVIGAAEKEAAYVEKTDKLHTQTVREMADFFKNFVDRCHHSKEEKHLFALMREHGMPMETGPLAVMLQEHERGRARIRAINEALPGKGEPNAFAIRKVKDSLAAYAQLLRAHIDREDNILYPMADCMFKPQDQKALAEAFDKVETEKMGEGVHEKYHAWIEKLIKE